MTVPSQTRSSIVVCTQNRAADLDVTCRSLMSALGEDSPIEVLVVDNGSTDRTPALLGELALEYPDRVRSVLEPRPGLSLARNRGVLEAHGEIIVFLDDDALPSSAWLGSLLQAFDDPSVGAAGGPVEPTITAEFPDWFSARFLPYLSAWDLGEETLDLRYSEYPRGTNIAFRRSTLQQVGLFLPQLGRRGSSLRSCEEIELCLRLERSGSRILYIPDARVRHKVDISRLTPQWMVKRFAAQGFSEAIMEWRHAGFEGLNLGRARSRNQARTMNASGPPTERLLHDCYKHAARGYSAGSLYAPLRVPQFRPGAPSQSLGNWLPPR